MTVPPPTCPPPAVRLEVVGLTGIGDVRTGDDLAVLLVAAAGRCAGGLLADDVLCVSSKLLAKALGLWRTDRDLAVEQESLGVVAERRTPAGTTRIVRSRSGPVMAAAGVDASNLGPDPAGAALVLPRNPDAAAAALRQQVARLCGVRPGILVTDTSGRPWRHGQTDFALGAAGVRVVDDLRGSTDADGQRLDVTVRGVGDEVAAAAELVKGKASGIPAAVVRGLPGVVTDEDGPGARSLVRTGPGDWFATGDVESVRSAVGCPPGTPGVEPAPAGAGAPAQDVLRRAAQVVASARDRSGTADLHAVHVQPVGPDGPHGPEVALHGPLVAAVRLAERISVVAAAEGLETTVSAGDDRVVVRPLS